MLLESFQLILVGKLIGENLFHRLVLVFKGAPGFGWD